MSQNSSKATIIAALIGLFGTLIVGLLGYNQVTGQWPSEEANNEVADSENISIDNFVGSWSNMNASREDPASITVQRITVTEIMS